MFVNIQAPRKPHRIGERYIDVPSRVQVDRDQISVPGECDRDVEAPEDKGRAAGVTGYSRVTSRGGLSSRKAMNLV